MAGDGMDLDAILAAFVEERGESALAVPPNEGLNRLAWGVPVVGISSGILLILMWTRRWSRDVPLAPGIATATDDDALLVEFDDELAARS
jgi:cytochrome c-type biogenesis protein CcmH/NrfF